MVPQAAGAENTKQVSNMLTMSIAWTCGILLIPVMVMYFFMGEIISIQDSAGYGYGYDDTNTSGCGTAPVLLEPPVSNQTSDVLLATRIADGCDLKCTVTSYSRACISYLLPYMLVETTRCWLGSLEIVTILAPVRPQATRCCLSLLRLFLRDCV